MSRGTLDGFSDSLGSLQATLFQFAPAWLMSLPAALIAMHTVGGAGPWRLGHITTASLLLLAPLAPLTWLAWKLLKSAGAWTSPRSAVATAAQPDFLTALWSQLRGTYAVVEAEAMYVPDALLAERVPGLSCNSDNEFVLYGGAHSRASYPLNPQALAVWRVRTESMQHRIEADPILGAYRVRAGLAQSVMEDSCKVTIPFGNITYVHAIRQHNLQLRNEIKAAVGEVLSGWNASCAAG